MAAWDDAPRPPAVESSVRHGEVMKISIFKGWLLLGLGVLASGNVVAQTVRMQSPVPFAEDNDISDAIKTECTIGQVLADALKASSKVPIELSAEVPDKATGRVLQMEIVDAVSMGNAFMGHQKFTKVRGTLYQDGEKFAAFKARRNSMGGAFAGFKGSCTVLNRTVKVLGEDIAGWLVAPRDGAALGD